MTVSVSDRYAMWDQFLARWPLKSLGEMTLQQYTQAGDKDSFTNWLETGTEDLGSMWGGSSFKFGVYSRKNQSAKTDGEGLRYTQDYAWLNKYGETPEVAFREVRTAIVQVAEAASRGDLAAIDEVDLGTVTKWKIAFLYQDRAHPCVLPIFKRESLQSLVGPGKQSCAALQYALTAKRHDLDLLAYGDELWSDIQTIEAAKLGLEAALAYLESHDGLQPVKEPTKYLAGFKTASGLQLALVRTNNTPTLCLSPGDWLDGVRGELQDIKFHAADKPRNSNLAANAPSLAVGQPMVQVAVPSLKALMDLCEAYIGATESESADTPSPARAMQPMLPMPQPPLNQILYGPPGTGKTYATVNAALAILDPAFLASHGDDRAALKARFDALIEDQRIRFVTFHQSFSYEDFVEGLRATTSEDAGQIRYEIVDGVFKVICEAAAAKVVLPAEAGAGALPTLDVKGRRIWKMSLGNTLGSDASIYDECIASGYALLGYGGKVDFAGCKSREEVLQRYQAGGLRLENAQTDYGVTSVTAFVVRMKPGDLVVISDGNFKFRAIGEVAGDYALKPHSEYDNDYSQMRPVRWLRTYVPSQPHGELMNNQFSQMTLYELRPGSIDVAKLQRLLGEGRSEVGSGQLQLGTVGSSGYEITRVSADLVELNKPNGNRLAFAMSLLNTLAAAVRAGQISVEDIRQKRAVEKLPGQGLEPYLVNGYPNILAPLVERLAGGGAAVLGGKAGDVSPDARVLIIDEINRGNISRIFGELITLIEPSKRAGADEALEAVLPYSQESFSVPGNVYLIGTMNTADRSLAGLDIALRRRFVFKEMPPQPDLLRGVEVAGVDLGELLATLNQRIEALLDREHCLGHAYFMPLKAAPSLAKLSEVFRNQVLPLLQEYFFEDWQRIQWVLNDHRKANLEHQFVQAVPLDAARLFGPGVNVSQQRPAWRVNGDAFMRAESYLGVLDATAAV
ncbi:AAA family ATPase [Ideonella azotifigens]|uniref:ATPase dynein-related AAA domain-containing protein n=1 Tax=Ideonella azotifigens TaxID=513160 RepID=A0ABN1K6D8_9BURK|nr:AAA family ATPase [Ideonella azotifigens]MCD2342532.1 AAA family ATPase [Ideonella azotifigens]